MNPQPLCRLHIVLDSSAVFRLGDKAPQDPHLALDLVASLLEIRKQGGIVSIADLVIAEIHRQLDIIHADPHLLANRLEQVISKELPIFPARRSIRSFQIADYYDNVGCQAGFRALLDNLRSGAWAPVRVQLDGAQVEVGNRMADAPRLLEETRSTWLSFMDDVLFGAESFRKDRKEQMDQAEADAVAESMKKATASTESIEKARKRAQEAKAREIDDEQYRLLAERLPTMVAAVYLKECALGSSDIENARLHSQRCDYLGKKLSRYMVEVMTEKIDHRKDAKRNDGIDIELDFILFLPCLIVAQDGDYLKWRTKVNSPQSKWIMNSKELRDHLTMGTLPNPVFA